MEDKDIRTTQDAQKISETIFRADVEPEKKSEAYRLMGMIGAIIAIHGIGEAIVRTPGQDIFQVKD